MTATQVSELLAATPFRTFELLFTDGRSLVIEHPDLVKGHGEERLITTYSRPDQVEIIDLAHVVSVRFRLPGLFDDQTLGA
jgi:hypothetical protein